MIVNEFAQWAAIAFLAILVLGLTRQLGHFLVPRREELAMEGPALGKPLPDELLDRGEKALASDALRPNEEFAVAAVLSDSCPGCLALIRFLEEERLPAGVPALVGVVSGNDDFVQRTRDVFRVVVRDDGTRAKSASVIALPYVMVIDRELRVQHRAIDSFIPRVLDQFPGTKQLLNATRPSGATNGREARLAERSSSEEAAPVTTP